jgi:DNA invertase Pin-like site-specific DNA recombinase
MHPHHTPNGSSPSLPGRRRVCLLERESDQAAAPEAIATQDRELRREVARRGDDVVHVCVEAGFSGALPPMERPGIVEMLDLAARGRFDYVLATELSRVNRGDAYQYYFLRHELQQYGVQLEFLNQDYRDDGESEAGALLEGIFVLLPSIERRGIVRRFAAGKRRCAEEGFSQPGRGMYGLDYIKGGRLHHRWQKREAEVPHVQRIFELAATGVSRENIAKLFNQEGVPTRRGGKWWGSTIGGIISNPRYKGAFPVGRYESVRAKRAYKALPSRPSVGEAGTGRRRIKTGKRLKAAGEWVTSVYRPECQIVSAELWQRANDMACANAAASPRSSAVPRLLKGLVYHECPHGPNPRYLMHAHNRKRHKPEYKCGWSLGSGATKCGYHLPAEQLDDAVWELVCTLALEPNSLVGDLMQAASTLIAERRRALAQQSEARALVERHQRTLDNLTLAHYAGDLVGAEYERVRALAQAQLREAEAALARLEAQATGPADPTLAALIDALRARTGDGGPQSCPTEVLQQIVQETLGAHTRAELDALDLEGRRARVRQIVERVEVGAGQPRARLRLGGRVVDVATAISPACPAGRRRAGGGAADRSGAGRAPAPWRSSGRC